MVLLKCSLRNTVTALAARTRIIEIFKKFDANNGGVISKQAWVMCSMDDTVDGSEIQLTSEVDS